MAETIYFIFDKIFKRLLTLSSKAVINLINGLFGTDYPTDSKITYNWTEFEDDTLRKTLADTILTINDVYNYHIEAQMENDSDIIFRVFEYGFQHANRGRSTVDDNHILKFPEPKIIYLYSEKRVPEKYGLHLDFGTQGSFDYQVSTLDLLNISAKELNEKKMILLIPFHLLKLRRLLAKARTSDNIEQLRNLMEHDILGSIETNLELGNISPDDSRRLFSLTRELLNHLYTKYPETEEVRSMYDQALITEWDPILDALDEAEKELEKKKEQIAQKDEQLSQKDEQLSQLKAEIASLKAALADATK